MVVTVLGTIARFSWCAERETKGPEPKSRASVTGQTLKQIIGQKNLALSHFIFKTLNPLQRLIAPLFIFPFFGLLLSHSYSTYTTKS